MNPWLSLLSCRKTINYEFFKQLSTAVKGEFKTVYKLPYVRGLGIINRLKLYQTVLTSMTLPSSAILNFFDVFPQDYVVYTACMGLAGIIPLYSLGYFTNKLIGIVYLNENRNLVKFAYLDFWGSRRDIVVPLDEIQPFSDSPPSLTDILYLKVKRTASPDMKLCVKYGIIDYEGFNKVFIS